MQEIVEKPKAGGLPISVIICTYNRAHLLRRTLHSLTHQTISNDRFEVIVVDDGSQDDTAKVCEMMRYELPNLKYISAGSKISYASARNMGIETSKGDYLLFTDDDCIPAEDWVERTVDALGKVPIVAGAIASIATNYFKLCHNIAQFHPFMLGRRAGQVEFISGANMAFRRSILEELKGFKKGMGYAEDMDFILRARAMGYRIFFVPDTIVVHDPDRTTLKAILKYSADHASATIRLRNQYRSLLRTPFILRSPVLILLTSLLIAFKVTAGIYLSNRYLAKFPNTIPVVYALKLAWCWGAARGLRDSRKAERKP